MSSTERFRFSRTLDHESLDQIYDGDREYAAEVFQLFLQHSLPSFQSLPGLLQQRDFIALKNNAHQLKTAFRMVGLPKLAQCMSSLEKAAAEPPAPSLAGQEIETACRQLEENLPLIKAEHKRLNPLK